MSGRIGELKTAGRGWVSPLLAPSPPRMPTVGRFDILTSCWELVVGRDEIVDVEVVASMTWTAKLSECTKPNLEGQDFESWQDSAALMSSHVALTLLSPSTTFTSPRLTLWKSLLSSSVNIYTHICARIQSWRHSSWTIFGI